MIWGVFGETGLLGRELVQRLTSLGYTFRVINRLAFEADLIAAGTGGKVSLQTWANMSYVLNLSGYTRVDEAERESEESFLVNATYSGNLAETARILGIKLIHISTDYVFDGSSKAPYKITDTPNPQSTYGRSKLAGEIAVQESGADYQIFRTAWLYGANGNCFPKTVARVLKEQGQMKVVNDQIGQPTWTKDLAELIIAHQDLDASLRQKIVHATASGSCSWYEFACEIALSLGYDPDQVVIPITTAEYPTPAKRPAYSVLDNENETGLIIGAWRERWREAAPLVLAEYLK